MSLFKNISSILNRQTHKCRIYRYSTKKYSFSTSGKEAGMLRKTESAQEEYLLEKSNFKSWRANEMTLICTELRKDGKIKSTAGRFLKIQLCALHGLQSRDLRKLDGTMGNQMPAILSRSQAILINLLRFKVIIKSELAIFINPTDHRERRKLENFVQELKEKVSCDMTEQGENDFLECYGKLPFELIVLESILLDVCNSLRYEFEELKITIDNNFTSLENKIHWAKLKILLTSKKRINHFKNKVDGIKDSIEELLDSNSDMANLYLTSKSRNEPRNIDDHDEVELLLETYHKMVAEISTSLEELQNNMQSTEDILNIGLVGQRNELLLFELKLTMGTFAAGIGSFMTGLFGMNLQSHFENHQYAFYISTFGITACCFFVYYRSFRKMMKALLQTKSEKAADPPTDHQKYF